MVVNEVGSPFPPEYRLPLGSVWRGEPHAHYFIPDGWVPADGSVLCAAKGEHDWDKEHVTLPEIPNCIMKVKNVDA